MSAAENPRISPAKLAIAVKRLRAEQKNLDLVASDPIAIIGMGCRFPGGADSPEKFWTVLQEGQDCVGEIPAGRWKDSTTLPEQLRRGAYLPEIDGFDAEYFGISPRETQQMDPQQRLLLEVAWEALWDAGIEPDSVTNTDAGVFVAIYNNDYARLNFADPSTLTAHGGIGTAHSVAAGRLSFLLNIKGPSIALDSACSSSLVAVHLACQSLRMRECGLAIVGASSLKLLSDDVMVFSKWGMLASDGKCKTFDAKADGFVPGEGCGAVILKRLSDALQDGDRIRAVIRGTAVNHDGRTTVLTAPNGLAQEQVLCSALKNAMIEPSEVSYIESHGTGTSLGDPIEMEAVRNVYGDTESDTPVCVLGAVKTNLGHLEAAAGIAGLIKVVLSLEHGEIPKNLHFHRLNPEISLMGSRLKIATENILWARGPRARVAGLSSFGLGGTNSHILIEEAPLLPTREVVSGGRPIPLPAYGWQRQRYWLAERLAPQTSSSLALPAPEIIHPLLGRLIASPFVEGSLFESDINTTSTPYLADHSLAEQPILPFAAFLEIAAAAARAACNGNPAILNFSMHEPCFLSSVSRAVQVLVAKDELAIAGNDGSAWTTYAKGSVVPAQGAAEKIDLSDLRGWCNRQVPPDVLYRMLERTGLRYGPMFRTIDSVWSGPDESLAHLRLAKALDEEAKSYVLHPTLLDGCLQTVMVAKKASSDELFLPISVDHFELHAVNVHELWVHTKLNRASEETISADLVIADGGGNVIARLNGFTAKRTTLETVHSLIRKAGGSASELEYELDWKPTPQTQAATSPKGRRCLLIENRLEGISALADSLKERGTVCEIIQTAEFSRAAGAEAEWDAVIYDMRGESKLSASAVAAGWQYPEKKSVEFLLNFVKHLAGTNKNIPQLCLITDSTAAVLPGEDVSIAQAPMFGLVRTLALEHPETKPVLIDAGPKSNNRSVQAELDSLLAEEIAGDGDEPLIALRHGIRYVARLIKRPTQADATARKLQIDPSGRLEDLRLAPAEPSEPKSNEVQIEVRASGLNFRDVLTALGMLPPRADTQGAECAGIITRIGSNVQGSKVGDNVLAFAPGSFQTYVNVASDFVVCKPAAMTFAEAAGIPVAFLTAEYGLVQLAKLKAGQTVLVHAAAGGLGLAAVQLALRIGAKVFATAGSPEKRAMLQKLGIENVFDSRSTAFREEVLQATGGVGVDVVLNSLAGDFIRASFDVTAKAGCFLEVGKRGIWSAGEVAALGKGIRYFPFDLGDVAMENPKLITEMLGELMHRFSAGDLQPLPTALYAFEDATQAFRTMAQARHNGKIVLGFNSRPSQESIRDVVAAGTVLITGGMGALGLETARWLVTQGARNVVLTGRSVGAVEENPAVEELRAGGARVVIERADVASMSEVRALLDRIRATMPPLCAVFHAAGVVQDAVLSRETWSAYQNATDPKIAGAWNLHQLTQEDPIHWTVFYSSAASILGSPSQGSYGAANAFLDALAHHRSSRGYKTLSVNWGAWASAGMAARLSPEQSARWQRQGAKPMEASTALQALATVMQSGRTQVAIMDIDWQKFLSSGPTRRDAVLFPRPNQGKGSLQAEIRRNENHSTEAGIAEKIKMVPAAEQRVLLAEHVKVAARKTLGFQESAAVQQDVPLQDLGLDSLMALEMRNDLAQSLAIPLNAGLLFDYPSVDQLTEHLLGLLAASASSKNLSEANSTDRSIELLNALTEEDAEQLLMQELDRAEREKTNV